MDMDPTERDEMEWVSKFCPVKGSTYGQVVKVTPMLPYNFGPPPPRVRPRIYISVLWCVFDVFGDTSFLTDMEFFKNGCGCKAIRAPGSAE